MRRERGGGSEVLCQLNEVDEIFHVYTEGGLTDLVLRAGIDESGFRIPKAMRYMTAGHE